VKVIPGREEARLTWLAVSQSIDVSEGRSLIVDIGGGSVELILVDAARPVALHSLKLGVARLSDTFFDSDPPGGRALRGLRDHLDEELGPVVGALAGDRIDRLVGTSGTMLCLASMAAHRLGVHRGQQLHGLEVPAASISDLASTLRKADRTARLTMKGIDAKRVDQILAGALVADYVVRGLEPRVLVACTWALREGILVDYVARHGPGIEESARIADVRRRSVVRLQRRLGQAQPHVDHVARIATILFDRLRVDLDLDRRSREWLEYAALLHDVGHLIDQENHHAHSYYLIVHGELFGFTRDEVEIIGQVARLHHRKGSAKGTEARDAETGLSRGQRRTVRALGALLRLAEGLDRTHWGVVSDVKVRRRAGRFVLELVTDGHDAALEVWEGARRTDALSKLLRVEVDVRIARAR